MTRFIQQQIQPMTERSVPQAPCPSCPAKAASFLEESGRKKKKIESGKLKANKK